MMERIKSTNVRAGVAKYLERSSKNIPMNGKDFACGTSQCNKMFKTTGGATQHAKDKHGERKRSSKNIPINGKKKERKKRAKKDTPCVLKLCNKLLRGKLGSVRHAIDSHREEAEKQDILRQFLIEEGKIRSDDESLKMAMAMEEEDKAWKSKRVFKDAGIQ
jgi:hypothetical protein